jgi:hypothetical protein
LGSPKDTIPDASAGKARRGIRDTQSALFQLKKIFIQFC